MEKDRVYYLNSEEASHIMFLNGNRNVNMTHAKKLATDLRKMGGAFFPPIIVDEVTNTVIDGQHRLTAYRILWDNPKAKFNEPIKVLYNKFDHDVLNTIIKMNNNQRGWSLADYIDSQNKTNQNSIKRLQEFCMRHDVLHRTVKGKVKYNYYYANCILLGSISMSQIKNGTYTLTDEQTCVGDMLYDEAMAILDKFGIKAINAWIQRFYSGWYKFRTNSIISIQFDHITFPVYLEKLDGVSKEYTTLSTDDWVKFFSDSLAKCL